MSYQENPYYYPETFGLTLVGTIDSEDARDDYGFDIFAVWKDEEGNFYWASDSGCSCPSPFEEYTTLADLSKGNRFDAAREAGKYGMDSADLVEKIMRP